MRPSASGVAASDGEDGADSTPLLRRARRAGAGERRGSGRRAGDADLLEESRAVPPDDSGSGPGRGRERIKVDIGACAEATRASLTSL